MKLSRISLQISGVWPDSEKSDLSAFLHYASRAGYLLIVIVIVQAIQLIIIWGDVDAMSDIMAFGLLFYAVSFSKISCLWFFRKSMLLHCLPSYSFSLKNQVI